jgi:hypothetical protein
MDKVPWNGSSRILYVDDAEATRDTQASLQGSTGPISISIGSTTATFWKGMIDDVRICDRAVAP